MVDIAISTVIAKTEKLEQRPVSPKISKKKRPLIGRASK
jgi:hypothetical protein